MLFIIFLKLTSKKYNHFAYYMQQNYDKLIQNNSDSQDTLYTSLICFNLVLAPTFKEYVREHK